MGEGQDGRRPPCPRGLMISVFASVRALRSLSSHSLGGTFRFVAATGAFQQ